MRSRSQEKEILDLGPGHYTPAEFTHSQKMLYRVNWLLGCLRKTVGLIKRYTGKLTLLDVGCGGGLITLYLGRRFPEMQCTGIDIAADAIQMAEQEKQLAGKAAASVSFQLTQPALDYPENHFDIVLANMVCHHLTDAELVVFFQQAVRTARRLVILNDLHRSAIAYWFFRITSPVLFRDKIITHDGLLSIRRSFMREDWERLLKEAGVENYKITWCFPFWWQVVISKK